MKDFSRGPSNELLPEAVYAVFALIILAALMYWVKAPYWGWPF